MTATPNSEEFSTALRELRTLLAAANRCSERLHAMLGVTPTMTSNDAATSLSLIQDTPIEAASVTFFDRYQWGRTVAQSLEPEFDSSEFARRFREALPVKVLNVFDHVRLKKILLRLTREGVIVLIAPGRGRSPARYQVVQRRRRPRETARS